MGLFGDIGGAVGGIAGLLGGDDGSDEAKQYYKNLAAKAGMADPTITAQQTGPSAYGSVDPTGTNAEKDALRELQTQYQSGGLDAQGKAGLAQAETEANRETQARSNAVTEGARANGVGNSGVTLALKQAAGQEAATQGSQQALNAAALAQGNRNAALSGAGSIGGNLTQQGQTAAAGQDAASRYNATMRQAAQGQTFQNRMQQTGQQGSLYGNAYQAAQNGDQRTRDAWRSVGTGIGGIADYVTNPAKKVQGVVDGG